MLKETVIRVDRYIFRIQMKGTLVKFIRLILDDQHIDMDFKEFFGFILYLRSKPFADLPCFKLSKKLLIRKRKRLLLSDRKVSLPLSEAFHLAMFQDTPTVLSGTRRLLSSVKSLYMEQLVPSSTRALLKEPGPEKDLYYYLSRPPKSTSFFPQVSQWYFTERGCREDAGEKLSDLLIGKVRITWRSLPRLHLDIFDSFNKNQKRTPSTEELSHLTEHIAHCLMSWGYPHFTVDTAEIMLLSMNNPEPGDIHAYLKETDGGRALGSVPFPQCSSLAHFILSYFTYRYNQGRQFLDLHILAKEGKYIYEILYGKVHPINQWVYLMCFTASLRMEQGVRAPIKDDWETFMGHSLQGWLEMPKHPHCVYPPTDKII